MTSISRRFSLVSVPLMVHTPASHSKLVLRMVTHTSDTLQGAHKSDAATKARTFRTFLLAVALEREQIKARIAQARTEAGLTQPELADLLEVHWRTVQNWESPNEEVVPFNYLDRIAVATNASVEWLLHDDKRQAASDEVSRRIADAAEQLGQAGADLVQLLGQLQPLLAQQEQVVARLQSVVEELQRREAAS